MDVLLALGILIAAILAGFLGSLFGIGGGIILVPALSIALGLPIKEAIGASLIGVIASSTGAASRYLGEGLVNIRLGMLMEPLTAAGSIAGALLAVYLNQLVLALVFALILVYSAYYMFKRPEVTIHPGASKGQSLIVGSYIDPHSGQEVRYGVRHLRRGLAASFGAGGISGLLGIGGGIVKVPVMNVWMGVPMRAATATSNFMIGVTALAGAAVFYANGLIAPVIAATVAIGVFAGASIGPRLALRTAGVQLRMYFAVFVLIMAALMVLKAVGVPLGV